MRKGVLTFTAILVAFSLGWAARDYSSDLLKVHEQELQAHLKTDASMLSPAADPFVTVSNGKIEKVKPAEERAFFTDYFRNARYPQYEDAEPPIIRVSKDGTLGYVISRVRAHRVERMHRASRVRGVSSMPASWFTRGATANTSGWPTCLRSSGKARMD